MKITTNTKIFAFTIVLLISSSIAISYLSLKRFEREFIPEMDKKAATLGGSINSLLTRAVEAGIPFEKINGTEEFFDTILKDNPDIKYLTLTDTSGEVVSHAGSSVEPLRDFFRETFADALVSEGRSVPVADYLDSALPVTANGTAVGALHVGVDRKIIQNRLKDIMYDIITVLLIALLVAFEILFFLITYTISAPINNLKAVMTKSESGDFSLYLDTDTKDEIGRFVKSFNTLISKINDSYQRVKEKYASLKHIPSESGSVDSSVITVDDIDRRYRFSAPKEKNSFTQMLLIYIRPALFLLIFSESLSLSFFPLYVNELYSPLPWISKELVIGLPISIFMLFWALSLPAAGRWSDMIGRRKPFITGAILTSIGLVFTGMSPNILVLLISRSITAVGYGIVFISCQGYVTDNTEPENRTRGMALFLAGFFSGSLCGAAIGGIMADRIGYRSTFFLSAGLALVSALFVYQYLHDTRASEFIKKAKEKVKLKDFKLLFSNKRFLTLTLFSAIPAKICLTGFLYYMGPLYLKQLGNTQSNIGRVLMSYGLAMVIVSPLVGKLADMIGKRTLFISFGGLFAGLGLLMIVWMPTTIGLLISVTMVGLAHSIGISSQLTLITEVSKKEAKVIGTGTVIGIFRLSERLGNVAGPLIAGALIAATSFSTAIAIIGIITITGIVLFIISNTVFDIIDARRNASAQGGTGGAQ